MNTKFFIGGVVVVVVGLSIFGKFSNNNTTSGTASIHNSILGGSASLAPDFTLQKLGGGTIMLSEFRGKKPVVVDFWACFQSRSPAEKVFIPVDTEIDWE